MINITKYEEGMEPEPGNCYSDLPNDEYHHKFTDYFSSTDLKNCLRSREYFFMMIEAKKNQEEKEYKIAFEVGLAFHDAIESLILYDDLRLFEQNTISFDGKSMSKKFLDLKAAYPAKNIVPAHNFESIPEMARKAKAEADELNVFHNGHVELSFFWIDKETGIKLKCRTDYIRFDPCFITDFKKSKDCSEKALSKDIANFNYHLSAAMYIDGVAKVAKIEPEEFCYIAVNDTKPFEVEHYFLDSVALREGNFLYRKILDTISNREKHKPKFKKIGVPFWALTHLDKGL